MKIQITATVDEVDLCWCVYTLKNPTTNEIEFVGHCKLVDILKTPGVRGVPGFENKKQYVIEMYDLHRIAAGARNAASRLITQLNRPKLNQLLTTARHCQIECVETGQRWGNAAECTRQQGISSSALSNHLNNKPGHVTIRGLSYRRIQLPRPNLDRRHELPPEEPWFAVVDPSTNRVDISQTPTRSKNCIASGDFKNVVAAGHVWHCQNSGADTAHAFAVDYGLY